MKLKKDPIFVIKTMCIYFFAALVFYFLFSNTVRVGSLTFQFLYSKYINENDVSTKTLIEEFPEEFSNRFSREFYQRNIFTYLHDSLYLFLFNESCSSHFYISKPKENQLGFLTSHSIGNPNKNRYDLFFEVLQGGFGDVDITIEAIKKKLLENEGFFEDNPVPSVIVMFPTKHFLELDKAPKYVRESLVDSVYDNPVQQRIYNSLPENFRKKYIINVFPAAISENKDSLLIPLQNFHWIERSRYTNLVAVQIARRFGNTDADLIPINIFKIENIESDTKHLTNLHLQNTPFPRIPQEIYNRAGIQTIISERYTQTHYLNPGNSGTIAVFGDSFAEPIGKDLALYFKDVWTFSNTAFTKKNISFVQKELKPDYMVFLSNQGLFRVNDEIIEKYKYLSNEVSYTELY